MSDTIMKELEKIKAEREAALATLSESPKSTASNTVTLEQIKADREVELSLPSSASELPPPAEEYSSYKSDSIGTIVSAYTVKVDSKKDEFGRSFFRFDSEKDSCTVSSEPVSVPLTVIVFYVGDTALVNVNDIVMPLKEFLSITHMKVASKDKSKKVAQLRATNFMTRQAVHCKTSKGVEFIIPRTSISLLMMALEHLQGYYYFIDGHYYERAKEEEEVEEEDETDEGEAVVADRPQSVNGLMGWIFGNSST